MNAQPRILTEAAAYSPEALKLASRENITAAIELAVSEGKLIKVEGGWAMTAKGAVIQTAYTAKRLARN